MPVFISTQSATNRHGTFAIERTPPAAITPTGTGVACLVDQLPWGPSQTLTVPAGLKDLYNQIAPPGFPHAGNMGWLAAIRKAWPQNQLRFVRVLGTTAAQATALVQTAGAVTVYTVTAKYPGLNGNSMTVTSSAASDGVAGHIKLAITITGASGTTTDTIDNLPTNAAPSPAPDLSKLLLTGALTFGVSGTVALGTVSFTGGLDGTINALAYSGTQGANDVGIAKMETDMSIRHVFVADPGNALRAGVNSALQAHAGFMGDRVAYINGNSGQTAAAAQTDVANYRSTRVVYCDPWVYILDDVTAAKTLVPGGPFAGSVAAQLSPSTPISWKNPEVIAMLAGINDLEADRGNNAGLNTTQGIVTFNREVNGGFTFESGVVANAPLDPTRTRLTRTRMGDYIAVSFINSTRPFVDGPNVPYNQQSIVQALDSFMSVLKKNANVDPNHRPHVLDYQISNLAAANAASDLANGLFFVPLDVQTSSGMDQILLSIRFGENVTVQHTS